MTEMFQFFVTFSSPLHPRTRIRARSDRFRALLIVNTKIQERALHDRPREKLLIYGEDDLSDEECVALVVGSVAARPALDVARQLLQEFGPLRSLQMAEGWELVRRGKLGAAGAASLKAAFALGRRAARSTVDPLLRIRGGADLYERFRARFHGARKETFMAIYLDGRNRLVREERVSEGTLNAAVVHPREVFGPALRCGAASVVVFHNHPSGDPAPSAEDFAVTSRLRDAGVLVGIPLLDHCIIGDERYFSFLERGYITHTNVSVPMGPEIKLEMS